MKDLTNNQIERLIWALAVSRTSVITLLDDDDEPERDHLYARIIHLNFQVNSKRYVLYFGPQSDEQATRWFDAFRTQGFDRFLDTVIQELSPQGPPSRLRTDDYRGYTGADWNALLKLLDDEHLVLFVSRHGDDRSQDWIPALSVNSVFYIASSDSHIIHRHELIALQELTATYGTGAVNAWVARRRGCEPLEKYQTADYLSARAWLETRLDKEPAHV